MRNLSHITANIVGSTLVFVLVACSGSDPHTGGANSGGDVGMGGSSAPSSEVRGGAANAETSSTGGSTTTGDATGGTTGTSSTSSVGGSATTGGSPEATGGSTTTGGSATTGGSPEATGGSPEATGGSNATGGTSSIGTIQSGTWTGTTNQALPIEFDVNASGTAITRVRYGWSAAGCGSTGTSTTTGTIPISGGKASISGGFCPSSTMLITFGSGSSANGTLTLSYPGGAACPCVGTVAITWSASAP